MTMKLIPDYTSELRPMASFVIRATLRNQQRVAKLIQSVYLARGSATFDDRAPDGSYYVIRSGYTCGRDLIIRYCPAEQVYHILFRYGWHTESPQRRVL